MAAGALSWFPVLPVPPVVASWAKVVAVPKDKASAARQAVVDILSVISFSREAPVAGRALGAMHGSRVGSAGNGRECLPWRIAEGAAVTFLRVRRPTLKQLGRPSCTRKRQGRRQIGKRRSSIS